MTQTHMLPGEWKPGYPPGKMTAENKQWFLDTYEVYFAPMAVWHRVKATLTPGVPGNNGE